MDWKAFQELPLSAGVCCPLLSNPAPPFGRQSYRDASSGTQRREELIDKLFSGA